MPYIVIPGSDRSPGRSRCPGAPCCSCRSRCPLLDRMPANLRREVGRGDRERMDEVPLHHVRRAAGKLHVRAHRWRHWRRPRCRSTSGSCFAKSCSHRLVRCRSMMPLMTDEAGRIGVARDVTDRVSGQRHVRTDVIEFHTCRIGAHHVVGNRTSRRATDRVVADRSGYAARRGSCRIPRKPEPVPVPPLLIVIVPMLLLEITFTGLEAEVEDSEDSPVLVSGRCIVDHDARRAVQAANGVTGGTADVEQTGRSANRDIR